MSAESFLKRLKSEQLIDDAVVAKLQAQVGGADPPVPAQQVAGLLVEKGHLTSFQAKKLLKGLESGGDDHATSDDDLGLAENAGAKIAGAAPPPPPKKKTKSASPPPAPEKRWKGKKPPPPKKKEKDVVPLDAADVEILEDDGGLTPLGSDDLQPLSSDGLTPLNDAFGDDPMLGAMGAQPDMVAGASPQPGQLAPFRGKKLRANQWDSPWLLIGGGLLILLLMLGGWLVFVLTKGDATEMFKAAEKSYRGGSYSDAIDKYTKFLEKFPEDENAAKARVNRGMARLSLPVSGNDWKRSLEVAQQELPEIEKELAEVPEARTELANQLTKMARGFIGEAIDAARKDTKAATELLESTADSMKLVANPTYVPRSERDKPVIKKRIDEINEDIKRVEREISKEEELVATVQRMNEAADASKTNEAFELRILLMRKYGEGIGGDERVVEAVKHAAEKERELVQPIAQEIASTTALQNKDLAAQIILASRVENDIPEIDKQVAIFLARGSVYALDAGSGKVLWRHYVGEETTVRPQRMSPENDADVLLVDSRDFSLLRVDAFRGEPKWRLTIGRPISAPVISQDRILVADESGRLLEVNPETGVSSQQVQFPQNLYVGPGINSSGSYIYQIGEHSNVYVLSASDMKCVEVLYLGHKSGSVVTTPSVSQGHLFVAVNSGANYSVLHILEATNRGRNLRKVKQTIRLEGHIVVPLQRYGNRVVAVTNLGAIHVFEIDAADEDEPVQDIAKFAKRWPEPVVGYSLAASGYLWVADRAFSIFQLQTAKGEISQVKVLNDRDSFLAPPEFFGEAVVHVRRRRGEVGATVTAVNAKDGTPYWRTEVSIPIAGDVVYDKEKDRLSIVTAQASLFDVQLPSAAEQRTTQIENDAKFQAGKNELRLDLSYGITFADGRRTYSGPLGSDRMLRYDPDDPDGKTLRFRAMSIPQRSVAAQPVAFSDGMLVPASNGLIYHLDPAQGGQQLLPFQPPIQPGEPFRWHRPTPFDGGQRFVVVDGRNRLYVVEVAADPKPHLASKKDVELPPDVMGPAAVAGSRVFAATRGEKSDALVSYQLPALDGYQETVGDARITWGPHALADTVLYATDDQQIYCIGADHAQRWAAPFKLGFPTGQPAVIEGDFFVATANGSLVRLSADAGTLIGSATIGEPLSSGPYFLNGRLLVTGKDGVIHIVHMIQVPKK